MTETLQASARGVVIDPRLPRKASSGSESVSVPQTNTGGLVEYTKALERTVVKELSILLS